MVDDQQTVATIASRDKYSRVALTAHMAVPTSRSLWFKTTELLIGATLIVALCMSCLNASATTADQTLLVALQIDKGNHANRVSSHTTQAFPAMPVDAMPVENNDEAKSSNIVTDGENAGIDPIITGPVPYSKIKKTVGKRI